MTVTDDSISNPTANPTLAELMERQTSRRVVLAGGLASAAAVFVGLNTSPAGATAARQATAGGVVQRRGHGPLLGFDPIAVSATDEVLVPPGYSYEVLWRWGDPIVPSGPAFAFDASNSAADQALQAGDQHDGMAFFPLRWRPGAGRTRGLIAVNHEATLDVLLPPDGATPWTADKTAKSQAAHGVAIIEVEEARPASPAPTHQPARRQHVRPHHPDQGRRRRHAAPGAPRLETPDRCALRHEACAAMHNGRSVGHAQ